MTGIVNELDYVNTGEFRQIFQIVLPDNDKTKVVQAIKELEQIPGIKYACPNYHFKMQETIQENKARTAITRDDYLNQWGIQRIKAQEARNLIAQYELENVKVGIIDTGINQHPDLNISGGKNFYISPDNPKEVLINDNTLDEDGHGTLVAGIVEVVCPEVTLIPLKISEYSAFVVATAVTYAMQNNIGILNFSGRTGGGDEEVVDVLSFVLKNYTGLFVASAGNKGPTSPSYPASSMRPNIISVGATKENSDLCAEESDWDDPDLKGSCYGKNLVHLFAPGTGMISTNINNTFNYDLCGTSFSAPLVTGTAAMLKAYKPNLTTAEIKAIILETVDKVYELDDKCQTGGRLNVYKAIKSLGYEITLEKNGGSGGTDSILIMRGTQMLPSISYPTRLGYIFGGYYDVYNQRWDFGSNVPYAITSDITLKPRWQAKTWTVKYQTYTVDNFHSGELLEMTYDQDNSIYGKTITAENIDGYTFKEWRRYDYYYQLSYDNITKIIDKTVTIYNVLPPNGYGTEYFLTAMYDKACVTEGTLITLADGSQKAVETLTGDEMLLVWNLYTGSYDVAPILFIDSDPVASYEVIYLTFSDGTTVEVISEHGFWDFDLNKYVYLDYNAAQYIGHWFNKQIQNDDGSLGWTAVKLTGVEISETVTKAYSPVTYSHLCYYVNGMLSMPGGIDGLFNIFEVDEQTMTYDEILMQQDIETYGLFTYEDFEELISEEVFEAVQAQYLKVAIGKGLLTWEGVERLVMLYADLLP